MKALLFFIILGLSPPLCAQFFQNDFTDPDLSDWLGDLEKFSVIEERLQLSDPDPGSSNRSYLSILAPTNVEQLTTWQMSMDLDFAPSGSNFLIIYLNASRPELTGDVEGYYLKIGGISGDQDAIELYRQDGSTSTLLLSATAGAVGNSPVFANIQVTRSESGRWELNVDYNGGDNFQNEGAITDNTYSTGRYFGFVCVYSSTRSEAFSFDDVSVGPLFMDQTPPTVLSVTPLDQQTLSLQFDEGIEKSSAETPGNYVLSNGYGTPDSAERSPEDPSIVLLVWDQTFINQTNYTLTISGVADETGNSVSEQSISFFYQEVSFPISGELLITEIMADPSPPRALPNAEYIEFYNATDKILELGGVGISTGSSPKILPPYQLLPKSYLIVCDEDDALEFADLGATLGIDGFPALTNGGDQLILTDQEGEILADIFYELSWYRDSEKAGGGWSLELIQLGQVLQCPGNWTASRANEGGTPGQVNSVDGQALEMDGPILLSAYAESELEILLRFNKALDPLTATNPDNYTISGGLSVSDAFLQPGNRAVLLILTLPLQAGTIYEISASTSLADCLGNVSSSLVSRRLGLAQVAKPGDVVINELLFFPEVGGKDFIELYNRSEKTINLRDWVIINRQSDGSDRTETIAVDFLIFPREYVVVTELPDDILDRYTVNFPERLLSNDLPTMSNEGQLSMRNSAFAVIDSFAYTSDFHSPLLADERGVSLERINADAPTNSPGNWHSAAATAGFATPTYENSQYLPERPSGSNVISLAQKRFSPDGDGFEDLLLLQIEADRPGYLATIQIFDANGRLIRRLLRNEVLPVSGVYKWDGTHADGYKARIGIYVIWVELVHPDGTVERWQESCVLAGNLDD